MEYRYLKVEGNILEHEEGGPPEGAAVLVVQGSRVLNLLLPNRAILLVRERERERESEV